MYALYMLVTFEADPVSLLALDQGEGVFTEMASR